MSLSFFDVLTVRMNRNVKVPSQSVGDIEAPRAVGKSKRADIKVKG